MTSLPPLSDLQSVTAMDERLRQVPADQAVLVEAIAAGEAHVAAARAGDDQTALVRALGYLGEALRVAGRLVEAEGVLNEALARARRRDDERLVIAALIRLGECHRCADAYPRGEPLLREAVDRAADQDGTLYRDFALQHLGKLLIDAGRAAEAIPVLTEALRLRHAAGKAALVASTEEALDRAHALATAAR